MQTFANAEAVQEMARESIAQHHPELATARIGYVFVDRGGEKVGSKKVYGKVRRITGVLEHLLELDFLVVVNLYVWNNLSADKRRALVDHLLSRCWGEEDEDDPGAGMKWSLKDPDVSEFSDVLRRHGMWTEELGAFVSVAQQLDTDKIVDDAVAARRKQQIKPSVSMPS